jgi:outer membrane protein assembly factor BamE
MTHSRSTAPRATPAVLFAAACLAATLAGCTPYRIDIQQGNAVSAEQLAQVRAGMTREQVRFLLGTPLLADAFHDQRWDYVFHFQEGKSRAIQQRRLSLWFGKDGKVERFDADEAMKAVPPDATGGARAYDLTPPANPTEKK